jgi:DNA-binding transcriptional LysR family regulator
MEFRELSAFVAVVEEGGMSAAARRLHVSQSALSQTVSALERELGVTLLQRTSTDAMLVAQESVGVLISSKVAARLAGSDGVRLNELAELQWVGFPRSNSPAWFDELTGILRSHGIDIGPPVPDGQELIAAVKFASVSSGQAFALAPENGLQPLPDDVTWLPLAGKPVVRRTWVVWPAESRRRDVGRLIASFQPPEGI